MKRLPFQKGMVSSPDAMSHPANIATCMPNGFLKTIEVEPVGRWFLSHWERLHSARGFSTSGIELKNNRIYKTFESLDDYTLEKNTES